jgi:hypothetical protein
MVVGSSGYFRVAGSLCLIFMRTFQFRWLIYYSGTVKDSPASEQVFVFMLS